jgi:hypothetical protein
MTVPLIESVRGETKLPQLPPPRFATVWWQVGAVPRLPELKLGPANKLGLVHKAVHGFVLEQAAQEPPQSTPVSLPFRTPSLQVDVAEMPTAAEIVVAPPLSVALAVSE